MSPSPTQADPHITPPYLPTYVLPPDDLALLMPETRDQYQHRTLSDPDPRRSRAAIVLSPPAGNGNDTASLLPAPVPPSPGFMVSAQQTSPPGDVVSATQPPRWRVYGLTLAIGAAFGLLIAFGLSAREGNDIARGGANLVLSPNPGTAPTAPAGANNTELPKDQRTPIAAEPRSRLEGTPVAREDGDLADRTGDLTETVDAPASVAATPQTEREEMESDAEQAVETERRVENGGPRTVLLGDSRRTWPVTDWLSDAQSQQFVKHVEQMISVGCADRLPVRLEQARLHRNIAQRVADDPRLYVAYGLCLCQHNQRMAARDEFQLAVDRQVELWEQHLDRSAHSVPGRFDPYFVPQRELIRMHLLLFKEDSDSLEQAFLVMDDLVDDLNAQLPPEGDDSWRTDERQVNARYLGSVLAVTRNLYGPEADRRFAFEERRDHLLARLTSEEQSLLAQAESAGDERFLALTEFDTARRDEQLRRQQKRTEEGYYPKMQVAVYEDFDTWHRSRKNWAESHPRPWHLYDGYVYGWYPFSYPDWHSYYWRNPWGGPRREGTIGRTRDRKVQRKTTFTRTDVPRLPVYAQAKAVREYLPASLLTKSRDLLRTFSEPVSPQSGIDGAPLLGQVP